MGKCAMCCAGCITCCYGCKRKRTYHQNMSTKLTERVWFCILAFTFLATLANMFFWIAGENDSDAINHGFWEAFGVWYHFYLTFQVISYAMFAYTTIVLIFGFLHMAITERLQMHLLHKILISLTLIIALAFIIFSAIKFRELWHFIPDLLEYIGPFLQLIAVTIMTVLSWFVAGGLGTLQRRGIPIRDITIWYLLVIIALYITPIFIRSPCITTHTANGPSKPLLFAHKGAEQLAPENTNISFTMALDDFDAHGIESDVRISADGVPFVLHDETLLRTTNVKDVFPNRSNQPADTFTIDELMELDAGSWFTQRNPFLNAWFLSDEQKEVFSQQKVLTMADLFDLALSRNKTLLFDVREPSADHPFADSWVNITLDVIMELGLNENEFDYWQAPNGPHYVFFINLFDNRTMHNNYSDISYNTIRNNLKENITTNVWTVNKPWLFQYFWCAGAASVTTKNIQTLSGINSVVWQLTPTHYMIMWIMFDVASFVWIVVVFIIQITRKKSKPTRRFPMSSLH